MGNSGSVPNDNKGDNKISWDKLLEAYKDLIKIQNNDSADMKDIKKGIRKSYTIIAGKAIFLIGITVIYVSVMLGVSFARNFKTELYPISRKIGLILFVILAIFLMYLYFDAKLDECNEKKKDKNETIKRNKQDFWAVALDSLVEDPKDSYAALIEILAFTDVKSVYIKYIRFIQTAIMVGGICFLPSISDYVPANFNIPTIINAVCGVIFVIIANYVSNFASSKFDELALMNYKYSEMKRLLLEYYKEMGSFSIEE